MSTGTVYQGDDVDIHCEAIDALGAAVDLAGATMYCDVQLTSGGTPVACSTFFLDGANKARVRFSTVQTANFVAGADYVYDVRAKLVSGLVHTIGKGSFRALAARTPTPT